MTVIIRLLLSALLFLTFSCGKKSRSGDSNVEVNQRALSIEAGLIIKDGPAPRYINDVVFDGQGLIIFGGKNNNNDGLNDLWRLKAAAWEKIGVGSTVRWDHSVCFLDHSGELLVFGGRQFETQEQEKNRIELGDTWILKNGQWNEINTQGPSPRSSASLAYDKVLSQVLLFGGRNMNDPLGDTWIFENNHWIKKEVAGPSRRYGHTLSFDQESGAIYLFGGFDGTELMNDLWKWQGSAWEKVESPLKPSARMAHSFQFDDKGRALIFGGYTNDGVSGDLWLWDGKAWNELTTGKNIPVRLSAGMGFDPRSGRFIIFGGSSGFGEGFYPETWELVLSE